MEGININIIYQIIRLITFILIGFILVRWMEKRKGWTYSRKTDLYLIMSWNLIISSLLFVLDLINELYLTPVFHLILQFVYFFLYFLFSSLFISFFINFYVGFVLFKAFHKENKRDNVIIILLIVIVEYIIDNLMLYPITIFLT